MPRVSVAPTFEKLAKQDVQLLRIWHHRLLRNFAQIALKYQNDALPRPVGAAELARMVEALSRRGLQIVNVVNAPEGFQWTKDTAPLA